MDRDLTEQEIKDYQDALIADGFTVRPIYGKTYDPAHSAEFKRDGYTVQIYRKADSSGDHISIWGPPGDLAIEPFVPYNFAELERRTRICSKCGAEGETVRLGFAGRVCPACRVKYVDQVEYRGWCD